MTANRLIVLSGNQKLIWIDTIKPVYNHHPWSPKIVVIVDKRLLFRGQLHSKSPIWDPENSGSYWQVHSVQRIVAPITVHANTCSRLRAPGAQHLSMCMNNGMPVFTMLKPYFNNYASIFLKFLQLKIWVNQQTCKHNFGINIFDYEGHDSWHTR